MTLYSDEHCGIEAPHRHTGELVEGHFVEYWCPTLSGWIAKDELYGDKCACEAPHMKARVQDVCTEIIEILPVKLEWCSDDFRAYLWDELNKALEKRLFGGDDHDHGIGNGSVRNRDEDSSQGGSSGRPTDQGDCP